MNTELAWAAGLWDGEGCVTVKCQTKGGKVYTYAQPSLNMTDEASVRRFQAVVNVGKVYGPYHYGNRERNKPYYRWQCGQRDGLKVHKLLSPYLGEIKLAQWESHYEGVISRSEFSKYSTVR